MPGPEAIALLALAYRELAEPGDRTRTLSLGATMTAELLDNETDDAIFDAIANPAVLRDALPELAAVTPIRAEALLHAFPDDNLLAAPWASEFRARWDRIEHEMAILDLLGITARPHAMERLAGV